MARRPAVQPSRAFRPFASPSAGAAEYTPPPAVTTPAPVVPPVAVTAEPAAHEVVHSSAPPAETWEVPAATTPIAEITFDVAPTVTQEVQLVAERAETPIANDAIASKKESDAEITLEVPLFEYTEDAVDQPAPIAYSPPAAPVAFVAPEPYAPTSDAPNEQTLEEVEQTEETFVVESYSFEAPPAEPTVAEAPSESAIFAFEADPTPGYETAYSLDELTHAPDEPAPPTDEVFAQDEPESEAATPDYSVAFDPPVAEVAESPADESDLPAFLRDDPTPIASAPTYASESEPRVFVAPSSDPPADSLIDEVDAAFITSGLPTQELSASSLAAAEALEAVARRVRSGSLQVQGAAASASDAATLAAVLAALLADG